MASEMHEKCAVGGIVAPDSEVPTSALLHDMMHSMQHRGTASTGMASETSPGVLEVQRGPGLVHDVYDRGSIKRLAGDLAIGHNRYPTNDTKGLHLQPFDDAPLGFALGHNGNLPTTDVLDAFLERRHIHTEKYNDSEKITLAIAHFIRSGFDLPTAIKEAHHMFNGSYSCVAIHDGLVVAFRDPKGIRPLSLGRLPDGGYIASSETCAQDIVGAEFECDIPPGTMAVITNDKYEMMEFAEGEEKLDIFEMVYFARHDSMLYGERVNEVRYRSGEELAQEHPPIAQDPTNILVVPVPDTSVPSAEGYAETLGLRHRQAVIKNRYIGRTFMEPTQKIRQYNLRRKHNIIPEALKGRDVIFVDDSIVRMNTMPRLVEIAKQAGAKTVSVLISCPPVRFPDFYGIDTPQQSELAASRMTNEEMRREIDADYLGFLSLSGLIRATRNPAERFNLSCFNGEYPIDIGRHKQFITRPVSMEGVDI